MKIAIQGCAHGELEVIYELLLGIEENEGIKIDLLLCCGDFQSARNLQDLDSMAVPPKYADICSFYQYYSGEKVAPYLTIFIGGNHESSNYLQELPYGGWVAPNIFYLGYAGVIDVGGVKIGGLSGIYKPFDYNKGHFEFPPYDEHTKRSVYHIRSLDVFRLKQISQTIDIFLSHDWPRGIHRYGDTKKLLEDKPFFKDELHTNKLGSTPGEELLKHLKPKYWFAAHLHCKFSAVINHDIGDNNERETKFLALDKCLPEREFLNIIDIDHDENKKIELKYDLEWLTILHLTNDLLSIKPFDVHLPGPCGDERCQFTPTSEEKKFILSRIDSNLIIPLNFTPTAPAYCSTDETVNKNKLKPMLNPQTIKLCGMLGIDDPIELILKMKNITLDLEPNNKSIQETDSEIESKRTRLSLPDPVAEDNYSFLDSTLDESSILLEGSMESLSNIKGDLSHDDSSLTEKYIDSSSKSKSDRETELNTPNKCTFREEDKDIITSTPETKKFKRRNEQIYKPNE